MNNLKFSVAYQGALLIILSEFFLICSAMLIKQLAEAVSTEMIVFSRNLFALLLLLPWVLTRGSRVLNTTVLPLHLLRALLGVSAMLCLYYSWSHLPLAQAALIKQTGPLFMPLIALWWLGERISSATKWAVSIGFVGVAFIINPNEGSIHLAILIALLGALLGSLAKITVRHMSSTEPTKRIVFYFAFFATLFSVVPALPVWVIPEYTDIFLLLLMAGTSTIAQLLLTKGYSYAPAGQLAPFTYSSVVIAALLGWLFWDENVSLLTWLGITTVILAGIVSMQHKILGKSNE